MVDLLVIEREIKAISHDFGLGVPELPLLHVKPIHVAKGTDCTLLAGDNLSSLCGLLVSLSGRIGFQYWDPPYNTGKKFVYNDSKPCLKHKVWGRHANWMTFLLPRLVVAKHLLAESGVIALSIDDHSYCHLKMLMDAVFDERNFMGNVVIERSTGGKGAHRHLITNHEYLLIYGSTKAAQLRGVLSSIKDYNKSDEYGIYRVNGILRKKGDSSRRADRPTMFFPLYYDTSGKVYDEPASGRKEVYPIDSSGVERRWLWGAERIASSLHQLTASKTGVIYIKDYYDKEKRSKLRSIWSECQYHSAAATSEIKEVFGSKIFETPKPSKFLIDIVSAMSSPGDIVLDVFSGSGTMGHAICELNKREGARSLIMMESHALVPKDHPAYDMGFKTISDITKARLTYIMQTLSPSYTFDVIDR